MASKNTISTELFRKFLRNQGFEHIRTKGSHESWHKKGMTRPIVVQAGKKEIPIGVIRSNLRTIGITMKRFMKIISDL